MHGLTHLMEFLYTKPIKMLNSSFFAFLKSMLLLQNLVSLKLLPIWKKILYPAPVAKKAKTSWLFLTYYTPGFKLHTYLVDYSWAIHFLQFIKSTIREIHQTCLFFTLILLPIDLFMNNVIQFCFHSHNSIFNIGF